MSEDLSKLIIGIPVAALTGLLVIAVAGALLSSPAAPSPGDPMFDSVVNLTDSFITALELASLVGVIGLLTWMSSQFQ